MPGPEEMERLREMKDILLPEDVAREKLSKEQAERTRASLEDALDVIQEKVRKAEKTRDAELIAKGVREGVEKAAEGVRSVKTHAERLIRACHQRKPNMNEIYLQANLLGDALMDQDRALLPASEGGE